MGGFVVGCEKKKEKKKKKKKKKKESYARNYLTN